MSGASEANEAYPNQGHQLSSILRQWQGSPTHRRKLDYQKLMPVLAGCQEHIKNITLNDIDSIFTFISSVIINITYGTNDSGNNPQAFKRQLYSSPSYRQHIAKSFSSSPTRQQGFNRGYSSQSRHAKSLPFSSLYPARLIDA